MQNFRLRIYCFSLLDSSKEGTMPFRVGLFYFDEQFSIDLKNRLNALPPFQIPGGGQDRIIAEDIVLHASPLPPEKSYDLIIDRGSHSNKYAKGIFMALAFQGVYIINNPFSFHYFIANKDVGYALAHSLGINIPVTYVIPPVYSEGRVYPYLNKVNWDTISKHVGFPCYIKPAEGRGAFRVNCATNQDDLVRHYRDSGIEIMTVQRAVNSPYEWQVRCLCLGRKIIPIKYIFRPHDQSQYIFDLNFLTPAQGEKIINSAKILNRLFGYEMNSVEFILDQQGEPWAIDFNNPIPDARFSILREIYYRDYLNAMTDRVLELAIQRPTYPFLPIEINEFKSIAEETIPRHEKFQKALVVANRYYK